MVGSNPNRTSKGRNEGKRGRRNDGEQEAAELKRGGGIEPNIQMTLQAWGADCRFNTQGPELFDKRCASTKNTQLWSCHYSLSNIVQHLSPQNSRHGGEIHRKIYVGCLQTLHFTTCVLHAGVSTNFVASGQSGSISTDTQRRL